MIESILDYLKNHKIGDFDCGNKSLNDYLTKYAHQNELKNLSRTYLFIDNNEVIGYITLCNAQMDFNELPDKIVNKIPKYPIPCVRIARLAVDKKHQQNGIGKQLLSFGFKKVLLISNSVGVKLIVVDAKPESKTFYEKYGFISLPKNNLTYFLPIETILQAVLQ